VVSGWTVICERTALLLGAHQRGCGIDWFLSQLCVSWRVYLVPVA
jgi:hypothetical protein